MEYPEYVSALEREGRLFLDSIGRTPPDVPVATCPGWRMRDLVRHTGGVHRKVTMLIRERRTSPIREELESLAGGWPEDRELADWFRDGVASLLDALDAAPQDLSCYTLFPATSPRLMWARRQAHETAIHRADLELARTPSTATSTTYPADFAADGIDELLACYLARPGRSPHLLQPSVISIQPDDVDAVWCVSVGPDSYEVSRQARGADLVLHGTASDLYLLLWNRRDVSGLQASGDIGLMNSW